MVLASSLRGNEVMTVEGTELGVIESVTMDPETGDLRNLRLKAHGGGGGGYNRTDDGHLLVPADRIEARQDYLLVRPPQKDGGGAPDGL
ncbi:PRC-barrel domain-containing protein [Halobellus ruber]|uniref:PRC-barrel domain-containing protein n=1 Tax=Halobellus ruber TaxID=2761102 RepID=A0A7J9SJB8_9EURY|nr:PRC-barrel domain-containing protein [Halobellus ruber]MBB6646087.1 PRC-barrel domain-containing protein [Halobellus ruber]